MVNKEKLTAFDTRKYHIRPHVGVGILLVRDNKLLLVKRKYDPDAGYWSIPGGHLDLGERVKEAAEREVFEETGLKKKYARRSPRRQIGKKRFNKKAPYENLRIDPSLKSIFSQIGVPSEESFVPDTFQREALDLIEAYDLLVSAPTVSGKTWIASQAISLYLSRGHRHLQLRKPQLMRYLW